MSRKIQGVLFDFGGTLYDYHPSNPVIWSRIAKRLGANISPNDPRIWEGIRRQYVEATKRAKPFSKLSREEIHTLNLHVLSSMDIDGEYFCRVVSASDKIRFISAAKCYCRKGTFGSISSKMYLTNEKIESHFLSIRSHIDHLRILEDSERSRSACLKLNLTFFIC